MDLKFKLILLPILIIILMVMVYSYSQLPFLPPDYPQGPLINQNDRVMVVAPHPDDEVICNGGIVRYATENHIPIKVVVVTDGNDTVNSPLTRYKEIINATKILGLSEENIIFLGYRDGSLRNLLNNNWNNDNPFIARDGSNHTNYPYALYPNTTSCGSNLADNLETIIKDFQPTVIIYPSGDDELMDHQATNGFIEYATTKTQNNGSKYTYLLHLPPDWPTQRSYYPEYYLVPPKQLMGVENGPKWFTFNLNTIQERLKEKAILTYKTQVDPDSYLLSFLRKNELFAQYSTITVSSKSNLIDYSHGSEVPPTIFYDAQSDGKYQGNKDSPDIISFGMDINDDSSWMSIKTDAPPSSDALYTIHLELFHPDGGTERVEITAQNGSAQLKEDVNNNSITHNIPLIVKNNSMMIKIPSSLFDNSFYLILSLDSSKNEAIIDQTPWRVVKIT